MPSTRERGHTLVELLVVMLMFGIVMTLMSTSFSRIVASSGQTIKSVETDIGGLIGLELFRTELGLAGFGLPWSVVGASYSGEAPSHLVNDNPETDASKFNDPHTDPMAPGAPRAFVLQNDKALNGSDYLVLKGSALGWSSTSRSWSYLNFGAAAPLMKPSKSEVELVPGSGDRVIVVRSCLRNGLPARELVTSGSSFCMTFPKLGKDIPDGFRPTSAQDRYLVYGLAPTVDTSDPDDKVTFPFNRADYYLGVPDKMSSACAPGTAVLYRGAVSQSGTFWQMPILDCVADLQVMFVLDAADGTQCSNDLDNLSGLYGEPSGDAAESLRRHVKEVKVFILAQQGKKDPGYTYPGGHIVVGPSEARSYVSTWDESRLSRTFGSEWMHYHWKVYTIAVQPKNLD